MRPCLLACLNLPCLHCWIYGRLEYTFSSLLCYLIYLIFLRCYQFYIALALFFNLPVQYVKDRFLFLLLRVRIGFAYPFLWRITDSNR